MSFLTPEVDYFCRPSAQGQDERYQPSDFKGWKDVLKPILEEEAKKVRKLLSAFAYGILN